jgi:hypothetical protein
MKQAIELQVRDIPRAVVYSSSSSVWVVSWLRNRQGPVVELILHTLTNSLKYFLSQVILIALESHQ